MFLSSRKLKKEQIHPFEKKLSRRTLSKNKKSRRIKKAHFSWPTNKNHVHRATYTSSFIRVKVSSSINSTKSRKKCLLGQNPSLYHFLHIFLLHILFFSIHASSTVFDVLQNIYISSAYTARCKNPSINFINIPQFA